MTGERVTLVPAVSFDQWARAQGITTPSEATLNDALCGLLFMRPNRTSRERGKQAAGIKALIEYRKIRARYQAALDDGTIAMVEHRRPLRPDSAADQAYTRVQAKRAARRAERQKTCE